MSSSKNNGTSSRPGTRGSGRQIVSIPVGPGRQGTSPTSRTSSSTAGTGSSPPTTHGSQVGIQGSRGQIPLAAIPSNVRSLLKPHQLEGYEFLQKHLVDVDSARYHRGVLLAHSMGLGKTLTTLTYLVCRYVGSLRYQQGKNPLRVLILVPKSTIGHWLSETQEWLNTTLFNSFVAQELPSVFSFDARQDSPAQRLAVLKSFQQQGGILLLGYEQLVSVIKQKEKESTRRGKKPVVGTAAARGSATAGGRGSRAGTSPPPPPLAPTIFNTGKICIDEDETVMFGKGGVMQIVQRAPQRGMTGPLPPPMPRSRAAATAAAAQPSGAASAGATLISTEAVVEELEGLDIVVFDEAHRCRSAETQQVKRLQAELQGVLERIALTGTPMQNHLAEYGTMLQLVRPGFIDPKQFDRLYSLPIARGQCSDSSQEDRVVMHEMLAKLQTLLQGTVHRRGVSLLEAHLPPRFEFVVVVSLSPTQRQLYARLIEWVNQCLRDSNTSSSASGSKVCSTGATSTGGTTTSSVNYFSALTLRHVVGRFLSHPALLHGHLPNFANQTQQAQQPTAGAAGRSTGCGGGPGGRKRPRDSAEGATRTGAGRAAAAADERLFSDDEDDDDSESSQEDEDTSSSAVLQDSGAQLLTNFPRSPPVFVDDPSIAVFSSKLFLCLEIVKRVVQRGEKVVIFSLYLSTLELLRALLGKGSRDEQLLAPQRCYVLTGSTPVDERKEMVQQFNSSAANSPSIFLCSTKAGGVGINLTAANHCIIFDHHWNPSDDAQATFRIFRYGQQRPCFVYRLVCDRTAEDVVFQYALRKEWMSKKIVDLDDPVRLKPLMWRDMFEANPERLQGIGSILGCDSLGGTKPATNAKQQHQRKAAGGSPTPRRTLEDLCEKTIPVFWKRSGGLPKEGIVSDIVPHSFLLRDDIDDARSMRAARELLEHEEAVRLQESRDRKQHHGIRPQNAVDDQGEKNTTAMVAPDKIEDISTDLRQSLETMQQLFERSAVGRTASGWCEVAGARDLINLLLHWYQSGVQEFCQRAKYSVHHALLQSHGSKRESLSTLLLTAPSRVQRTLTMPKSAACQDYSRVMSDLQWARPLVQELLLLGASQHLGNTMHSRLMKLAAFVEQSCGSAPTVADRGSSLQREECSSQDPKEQLLARLQRILEVHVLPPSPATASWMPRAFHHRYLAPLEDLSLQSIARVLGLNPLTSSPGTYLCPRCREPTIYLPPAQPQQRVPAHVPPPQTECRRCHWTMRVEAKQHRQLKHPLIVQVLGANFRAGVNHLLVQEGQLLQVVFFPSLGVEKYGRSGPPMNCFSASEVVQRVLDSMTVGEKLRAIDFLKTTLREASDKTLSENYFVQEGATAFVDTTTQATCDAVLMQCGLPSPRTLRRQLISDPVQVTNLLLPRLRMKLVGELGIGADLLAPQSAAPTQALVLLALLRVADDEASALRVLNRGLDESARQSVFLMAMLRETLSRLLLLEFEKRILSAGPKRPGGGLDPNAVAQLEQEHRQIVQNITSAPSVEVVELLVHRLLASN